jgi:hypothetical protein
MVESEFDGEINGKRVKVIVRDKGSKTWYFAKPKDFDVNTPHFEVTVDGKLDVHEDSADGNSFRTMIVNGIYSGSFYAGSTFASNKGMDIAVLPMNKTADGFAINTSKNGADVNIPFGNEWCLMALGTYSPWQPKPERHSKT